MKNFIETLNGKIKMHSDGFEITGKQSLESGVIKSEDDHRVSMTAPVSYTHLTLPTILLV